jgi:23S rRNA (guanine2445-N2)-methyltransferase / 23S rRNA (guanine2069-N7)-methyltransferase
VTDSSPEEAFSPPYLHPVSKEIPTGDFGNRLRKNIKRLSKWAKRESISCYRIYDGDIPEYNVAVEIYGKWIHVQEYAPPKTVDREKAIERLKTAVREIREIFDIRRDRIFVKEKSRQRGRSQYQKLKSRGKLQEVSEGKCRLLINLSDYVDTGLFLDHRITRAMIQEMSNGKRFLNLFGYTGSATVHAAAGGAKSSVTVDLSSVYLEWARCNLALNGFSDSNHRLIKADCMEWLNKCKDQFDLIFIDPPTFSNTKKKGRIFNIQDDHVRLIKSAFTRLEPGGTMIFSTNHRRFKIDEEELSGYHLEDISRSTIPPDFERTPKVHRCWRIKRD